MESYMYVCNEGIISRPITLLVGQWCKKRPNLWDRGQDRDWIVKIESRPTKTRSSRQRPRLRLKFLSWGKSGVETLTSLQRLNRSRFRFGVWVCHHKLHVKTVETAVLLEHSFNNIFDCGPRFVWLFTHLQMLNKISISNRTSCSNFIISGEITTFLYELGYVLGGAQIPQL